MSSIVKPIKRRLIKWIAKIYNPLIDLKIGNQTIKVPFSHYLRENVVIYPDYNTNLPRIIKYVSDRVPNVRVIDIGANIGDTVAFIKNYTDVPILCIDGEEKYLEVLRKNVAQYSNVSVCHSLVGNETKETNLTLKMERGTAFVEESKKTITIRSLDDILTEFTDFRDSKILKIDTDGYDTLILRGSEQYLKRSKPILFFEFDPYLVKLNGDDPFSIISYLKECGYYYFIFYISNGDYLLGCSIEQEDIITQLIHYFSGRNVELYTDICAFSVADKPLYDICVQEETKYFKKVRNY